ncbi:MAG: DUF6152 family protein [Gammaproteobacteria bacterium]|jgi:hypothetical protein
MKTRLLFPAIGTAICAAFLCATLASAHHSFAGTYREGDLMTLEGTIVQFNIRNPHSFINIEIVDEDGNKVLWGGEWGSVSALSQGGVDRFTLKAGEHVIIEGSPPRDTMDRKVLVRRVFRPATDDAEEFLWEGTFR